MSAPITILPIRQPLQLGAGIKLQGAKVGDCTALQLPPTGVSVPVVWSTYGANSATPVAIEIDVFSLAPNETLDKIRSIYIDNTFSPTSVYVIFQDTGFTVICPPYSVLISPIWTNGSKAILYATGFTDGNIPTTLFTFSNMHVAGMNILTDPLTPPNRTIARTAHVFSSTVVNPHSFANVAIGAYAPSRRNVYISYSRVAANVTLTSSAFNGVSSTLLGQQISPDGTGIIAIWRANSFAVNLTTVTISVQYSANPVATALNVASLYNASPLVNPYGLISGNTINQPLSLITPENGVTLYGALIANSTFGGPATVLGMQNALSQFDGAFGNQVFTAFASQETNLETLFPKLNLITNETGFAHIAASFP